MDKHLLYSFRRCPYAMRARMGLVKADVPFDIHEVDLKNKPEHMLAISPKGTVPVLQTMDGQVIDESLDIIAWALPDEWAQADHDLITDNDGPFKAALDRYKYPGRFSDEDCTSARDNGEAFIQKLDQCISPDSQTLTDICIFPFVRQFAHVDRDWFESLPYNNVQKWLAFNAGSDLFKTIFDKKFNGLG
jgi:glutathione S-transferase